MARPRQISKAPLAVLAGATAVLLLKGLTFAVPRHAHLQSARPIASVRRNAAEESPESIDTGRIIGLGFKRSGLLTWLLTIPAASAVALGWSGGAAVMSAGQTVQVFFVSAVVLRVMQGAAVRKRLSGTTFKVLALALLSAFSIIFFDGLYALSKLFAQLPPLATSCRSLLSGLVTLASSWLAISSSYKALQENGLPNFKLGIASKDGLLLSILALGYAVTTAHSLWWGSIMTLYSSSKVVGAFRCFVIAACAHVCQTAAVAGTKRMSSVTYRLLNFALAVDSGARLHTVMSLQMAPVYYALPAIAFSSGLIGWLVGKLRSLQ